MNGRMSERGNAHNGCRANPAGEGAVVREPRTAEMGASDEELLDRQNNEIT